MKALKNDGVQVANYVNDSKHANQQLVLLNQQNNEEDKKDNEST